MMDTMMDQTISDVMPPPGMQSTSYSSEYRKKSKWILGGLAALVVIGGAVGAVMFMSGGKKKPPPVTYNAVSENLVTSNTLVVNSSRLTGGNAITTPLPAGAVVTPSWKAADDSKAAATQPPSSYSSSSSSPSKPSSSSDDRDWKQASAGTSTICYPKNGYEVVKMVNGSESPCRVVVLTKPFTYGYKIERQINVTQPKIIVGNPLGMPMLNCSKKIERCFEILPGGRLDTRFLIMVRAGGRYLNARKSIRLNMGTHVRVQVGGEFTATGTLFRERNHTLLSFQKEIDNVIGELGGTYTGISLGQYINVIGGNLFLQGCFFMRVRPYGTMFVNTYYLGREVLVIAGNAVFTGVINIGHFLYANYPWMSGKVLCVLGGTATMIGGASMYTCGPQLQFGYGIDLVTLGGMLVTVGWQYASWVSCMLRLGGGQIGVGAGTLYFTGLNFVRAWVVGVAYGAGQTYVNAAGNFQYIGGSYASFVNNGMYAGVGGNTWMGAGSLTVIGVPQARYLTTYNFYGSGGIYFNGAGSTTFIFLPQYNAYVAYYQAGIASDTFIGAGWLTSIYNIRVQFQLVYGFNGLGSQMYIGAGGAIFIKVYYYYKRLKYWTTTPYSYTVGGMGYKSKTFFGNGYDALVITKDQYTKLTYNAAVKGWKKKTTYKGEFQDPYEQNEGEPENPGAYEVRDRALGEEEGQGHGLKKKKVKIPPPPPGAIKYLYHKNQKKRGPSAYQRSLQDASSWLEDAVVAAAGVAIDKLDDPSSIVIIDSTVQEATGAKLPPLGLFGRDVKTSSDPYAIAKGINDPDATDVKPAKVAVGAGGTCFLCDVGPGNTADHGEEDSACEVRTDCTGPRALDSWSKAQDQSTQELSFPQKDFIEAVTEESTKNGTTQDLPDTFFLWYEMTVYCHSTDPYTEDSSITDNCLTEPYVTEVVDAFTAVDLPDGYDLAVSSVGIHASVKEYFEEGDQAMMGLQEALMPGWNPNCEGWTKYNLQFTTRDEGMFEDLQTMWNDVVQRPGYLSATIVENYNRTTDVKPCEVSVMQKSTQKYPAINNMPAFFPSKLANLAPDVVVSDGEDIVAADKIEPGKTYNIYAQNFPRGSTVQMNLMAPGQEPVPLGAISNFDDSQAQSVEWTAPADMDPDQRFYVKASPASFPSLFGSSQLLRTKSLGA